MFRPFVYAILHELNIYINLNQALQVADFLQIALERVTCFCGDFATRDLPAGLERWSKFCSVLNFHSNEVLVCS